LVGPGRIDYLRGKARTLLLRVSGGIQKTIVPVPGSKPLTRTLRDVREANYRARRNYVPGPYRGRVTLFRAAVRWSADSPARDMGWERLALGGVEIREVPGNHVNMMLWPQVALLAEQLRECIDRATGAVTPTAQREATSGSVPGFGS
jgi:thioesterase domain-containing protein